MIPPYFLSEILVQTALIVGQFWTILKLTPLLSLTILYSVVHLKNKLKTWNLEQDTRSKRTKNTCFTVLGLKSHLIHQKLIFIFFNRLSQEITIVIMVWPILLIRLSCLPPNPWKKWLKPMFNSPLWKLTWTVWVLWINWKNLDNGLFLLLPTKLFQT